MYSSQRDIKHPQPCSLNTKKYTIESNETECSPMTNNFGKIYKQDLFDRMLLCASFFSSSTLPVSLCTPTSSFSAFCRSLHSCRDWLKSTLLIGIFTAPMASCFEKRSKSYTVITRVFPPSSVYGTYRTQFKDNNWKDIMCHVDK